MIRRDTQAWILQTWIMFGIASFAAVFGLFQLELEFSTRLLMLTLTLFTLTSTFTLAKTIRDNQHERRDTQAWIGQSWAGFIACQVLTWYSLWNLNIDKTAKWLAFLAFIFLIQSTFTLSKTIRDNAEANPKDPE